VLATTTPTTTTTTTTTTITHLHQPIKEEGEVSMVVQVLWFHQPFETIPTSTMEHGYWEVSTLIVLAEEGGFQGADTVGTWGRGGGGGGGGGEEEEEEGEGGGGGGGGGGGAGSSSSSKGDKSRIKKSIQSSRHFKNTLSPY